MAKNNHNHEFNPQPVGFGTPNTGTTKILPPEPGVHEGTSTTVATQKATLPTDTHTEKNT